MKTKSSIRTLTAPTATGLGGAVTRAALVLLVMMLTTATARAQYAGSCGWGVNYSYVPATHTLTISATGEGSGEMADYTSALDLNIPTPWEDYGSEIQTIVINPGVTKIGSGTFQSCIHATSVTIPDGVTSIGREAFADCLGLPSITLPSSVTTIGKKAFSYCFGLTEITIPASVTEIADSVFYDCIALTNIFFQCTTPPTLDATAFDDCDVLANIYVSSDAWAGYVAADGWNADGVRDFIHPFEGYCGDPAGLNGQKSVAWGLIDEDGDGTKETIVISGISGGTMKNYLSQNDVPWSSVRNNIQKAVFTADLRNVGSYALFTCFNLTSVSFVEDTHLMEIGASAFGHCKLTSFTVPATVWNIGASAFSYCDGLESVTFADGTVLTTIGQNAFTACRITSFIIPDGVTSIGPGAFGDCSYLKSISIPASVTSIGHAVFEYCYDLATVYVERYDATSDTPITTLGKRVFDECESLAHIFVPAAALDAYADASSWNEYSDYMGILLSDTEANDVASVDGRTGLAVALHGRTLWKDGDWNTLCLPFSVDNFTGTPLEGATVKTLTSTSFEGGTLTMNFSDDLTSIEAGKPYIVKWASGSNISNPVFSGVTVSNTTANAETLYVDFIGTYSPAVIYESGTEKHNLFLGDANTLYYPTAEGYKVNACRGYFQLKNGLTAGEPSSGAHVRAFNLNFGEDETGIRSIDNEQWTTDNEAGTWYTLDGRRLSGKPTQRGVYVNNGCKIVIK